MSVYFIILSGSLHTFSMVQRYNRFIRYSRIYVIREDYKGVGSQLSTLQYYTLVTQEECCVTLADSLYQ